MTRQIVEVGRARTSLDGARRYMVVSFSFDFRLRSMELVIEENWDDETKALHQKNHDELIDSFASEYGGDNLDTKLDDVQSLGVEPLSVFSVHNELLRQVRGAFIAGSYFAALVGAAALGERILNQMFLALRDKYFLNHEATKRIRTKKSIDDWEVLIGTLRAWGVLTDSTAKKFRRLKELRHRSVHFGFKDIHESGGRTEALEAIRLLQDIVEERFGVLEPSILIAGTSGFFYLRRDVEQDPFVAEFYLPACALLSSAGRYRSLIPAVVEDDPDFDIEVQISDADFVRMTLGKLDLADIKGTGTS